MAQDPLAPFLMREDVTGIRTTWSCFVTSQAERQKVMVPYAAVYSPLKTLREEQVIRELPVICRGCGASLSVYDQIYAGEQRYACRFCGASNSLPPRMQKLSDANKPADLNYQTVEYVLPDKSPNPVSLIFVIDTCLPESEFSALIDFMKQVISLIPSDFRVGIITTGKMNHIYDVSSAEALRSYTFNGAKDYNETEYWKMLGLDGAVSPSVASRFLVGMEDGLMLVDAILSALRVDPFGSGPGQRESRGTGSAVSLALAILKKLGPNSGGRVMLFTGGPCTIGPGRVISTDASEKMRQQINFEKETDLKYYHSAKKYYESLGRRASQAGHCIDIMMGCQDQCGIDEMVPLVSLTGGLTVLSTSFASSQFRLSFSNLFDRGMCTADDLDMAFNAKITVRLTEHMKLTGCIGHCTSSHVKAPFVSTIEVGEGDTNVWAVSALDSASSMMFVWDVVLADSDTSYRQPPILQIQTEYTRANGQKMLRVTSIDFRWSDASKQLTDVIRSFDYECAAVACARMAVEKAEREKNDTRCNSAIRWIDKTLINTCQQFGIYTPGHPESFRLPPQLSPFPQAIYYLRRSRFLRVFNHAPDETEFYRLLLNREGVTNGIVMIQPTLLSFELGQELPRPVLLDLSSIKKDCILLLDTFFRLIIHHGETIAAWREMKYHEQPENAALKAMLAKPIEEAQEILKDRFPVPHVLVCDQGSSQARFLISQLNPSTTPSASLSTNAAIGGAIGTDSETKAPIFSDDVTLKKFFDSLRTAATSKQ
ncbi:Sec23B [Monocercomonoides exilis]|uniref:Sec23B n=1 Tax=Monocercomonoides exilis TaxID=2049356 RepID=UPI00355AA6DB|nr:Sec23B [Monocercomonoides exilis]|eukprot:MONOS_15066.1-p1 / transcript=MONOS_15066.1 / gene=MONOS_15066 / organism=Monocercomonoides_exilis_PA203 / gene_product= Sec23B / transcript_product= Sec23B / location=Mono_scaffold01137:1936-5610(-) / protein_length=768 / sequence_SO=supercontig / SO=protein_coding / is_pseudo=false